MFYFDEDLSAQRSRTTSMASIDAVIVTDAVMSEDEHHELDTDALSPLTDTLSEPFETPHEIIVPIMDVDFVTESKRTEMAAMNAGPSGWSALSPLTPRKVSTGDFELLRVIGRGAYGKVFLVRKATGVDNGCFYAMKVLRKAHIVLHHKDTEHTKTERSILEEVRHPFLVRLFYAFQTDSKLYLILDFASGGELFTYLEKEKMLLEDTAKFYMAELMLAIEHLHRLGIIYRDLKPENVLLDRDGHVLLTDFGLSKVSLAGEDRANTVCGTIEYMAPEVLANVAYGKAVDWWSFGALAFDMMTGSPPFTANNRKKTMDAIMNKKLTLPYYLSPDAKDLLTRLMRKNASVRLGNGELGAEAIKRHRFFNRYDWARLLARGYTPPLRPNIASPQDVSNFHSAFTSMPVVDSPPADDEAMTKATADVFGGFSYVAQSVIQDWLSSKDAASTLQKPS